MNQGPEVGRDVWDWVLNLGGMESLKVYGLGIRPAWIQILFLV